MKTCKYINSTLVFTSDNITPCYSCFSDKAPCYIGLNFKDFENIDFYEIKQAIIGKINNNSIREIPCYNCCQIIDCENIPPEYSHIILSF